MVENPLIRPYFLGGVALWGALRFPWSCVAVQQSVMFHPGGSDGVITDDSPQVVDVAASSNQGQARLATRQATSHSSTWKSSPPDRQSHEEPPVQAEARASSCEILVSLDRCRDRYLDPLGFDSQNPGSAFLKSGGGESPQESQAISWFRSQLLRPLAHWLSDLAIGSCQGEPAPATSSFALQAWGLPIW